MSQHAVVVKAGTSTLTAPSADHSLHMPRFTSLAKQTQGLIAAGYDTVWVSSGAIGLGIDRRLSPGRTRADALEGLSEDEKAVRLRTFASIGQPALMQHWQEAFGTTVVSQHLITNRELESDEAFPFIQTISDCLDLGVVPVINENDGISDEEIRVGDNDTLAARVAAALHRFGEYNSTKLILLTDIDGFYAPRSVGSSISKIRSIAEDEIDLYMKYAKEAGQNGTGGMRTKLEAGKIAAAAGIETIIAQGKPDHILRDTVHGVAGTRIYPVGR